MGAVSFAVLLIAVAGVATSALLDGWLPTWAASLSGLALVLILIVIRRRLAPPDRSGDEDAGDGP